MRSESMHLPLNALTPLAKALAAVLPCSEGDGLPAGSFTWQQVAALVAAPLLCVCMWYAYRSMHRRFGYPLGYLLAFAVYWLGWCLALPALLLGGPVALVDLLRPVHGFTALTWSTHLALWWPLIFPLLFTFLPRVRKASGPVLVVSLILGIIIGVTEEVLWRGLYQHLFPGSLWWGLIYPSVLFGLWHVCPLSVLPNKLPGGAVSFVGYAIVLGLTYGAAALATGSIVWPLVAHALHDTLGLGGFTYAAWFARATTAAAEATTAGAGAPSAQQRL